MCSFSLASASQLESNREKKFQRTSYKSGNQNQNANHFLLHIHYIYTTKISNLCKHQGSNIKIRTGWTKFTYYYNILCVSVANSPATAAEKSAAANPSLSIKMRSTSSDRVRIWKQQLQQIFDFFCRSADPGPDPDPDLYPYGYITFGGTRIRIQNKNFKSGSELNLKKNLLSRTT
jgi:hypothetical protein